MNNDNRRGWEKSVLFSLLISSGLLGVANPWAVGPIVVAGEDGSGTPPKPVQSVDSVVAKARKSIAAFVVSAECRKTEGTVVPQLPTVGPDVLSDLKVVGSAKDKDGLADIAAILVRYARSVQESQPQGALLERTNVLVSTFMSVLQPRIGGDEIVSSSLARWICQNRGQMGKSQSLDKEMILFQEGDQRLKQKYEEMVRNAEKNVQMLRSPAVPYGTNLPVSHQSMR
jgi:hypothetical protein